MKILVLISDRTDPPITGTRVRNHFLWSHLARLGVEIKILGLSNIINGDKSSSDNEIEFFPFDRPILPTRVINRLRKSFHESPRSQKLADRVIELCESWQPDIIHAEELRMSTYFPTIFTKNILRTITLHNVESELNRKTGSASFRFGRFLINWLHLHSLKRFEKRAILNSDLNFAYSDKDLEKYRELFPKAHWAVTRNATNASGIIPSVQKSEKNILIVGSLSYQPNVSGLFWFIENVLPHLPKDISVTVAGSNVIPSLRSKLEQTRIQFIDTPLNLEPLYQRCALCVVPVFEGSGTRGKILEALAYERMVITTKIGAEGLEITEGVVFSESAKQFIEAILKWTNDFEIRKSFAVKGRQQVLQRYDWSSVAADLKKDWEACMSQL